MNKNTEKQAYKSSNGKDVKTSGLPVTGTDSQRGRRGGKGGSSNVLVAETEEEGYFYILLLEMC